MRTAMSKAECKREYSGIALICSHNADRVFSAVVRSTADKLVGSRVKRQTKRKRLVQHVLEQHGLYVL